MKGRGNQLVVLTWLLLLTLFYLFPRNQQVRAATPAVYKVVLSNKHLELERDLNKYSQEGWELAMIEPEGNQYWLILKK
jgi:hypothetical protein